MKQSVLHLPEKQQVSFFIGHWDAMVEVVSLARPGRRWFLWRQNGRVEPYPE